MLNYFYISCLHKSFNSQSALLIFTHMIQVTQSNIFLCPCFPVTIMRSAFIYIQIIKCFLTLILCFFVHYPFNVLKSSDSFHFLLNLFIFNTVFKFIYKIKIKLIRITINTIHTHTCHKQGCAFGSRSALQICRIQL